MPSKLPAITVRLSDNDRARLQGAAEALTVKQNEEGRPGRLSVNDIAVTAIRKYLKELEEAGVLEPDGADKREG